MDSSTVLKPAYWRIVHGRWAYIVGYGPRVYGYIPGISSLPLTSSDVYNGFNWIPSYVVELSDSNGIFFNCLIAALLHSDCNDDRHDI